MHLEGPVLKVCSGGSKPPSKPGAWTSLLPGAIHGPSYLGLAGGSVTCFTQQTWVPSAYTKGSRVTDYYDTQFGTLQSFS